MASRAFLVLGPTELKEIDFDSASRLVTRARSADAADGPVPVDGGLGLGVLIGLPMSIALWLLFAKAVLELL